MYTVLCREVNGYCTEVATAEERQQADNLVERMKKLFPAEYEVRQSNEKRPSD